MRTILLGLTLILSVYSTNAQPTVKAVLTKNKFGYKTGDTIQLIGYYPLQSNSSSKYVTKAKSGTIRNVSPKQVKLIDTIGNFWDCQWYYHCSGDIAHKGWGNTIRNELKNGYYDYLKEMKANGFLVEDTGLLDYLNQLAITIGPDKLFKGYDTQITVHVIKADQPDIFSFDNGGIFITTELLAQTQSEEELIKLLSTEIAHIVCDHQFVCRKKQKSANTAAAIFVGLVAVATIVAVTANSNNNEPEHHRHSNYHNYEAGSFIIEGAVSYAVSYAPPKISYSPPRLNLEYTSDQTEVAKYIATSYSINESHKFFHLTQNEYTRAISPAITYTAWDLFFKSKYKESLSVLNRVENSNACGSDDYLLKAKIYRKLYNTDEANYEALKYIQLAKDASSQTNIDILKEEGLIYFHLKNMDKARASFEEYRVGLKQVGVSGEDDRDELNWVDKMIQKTNSAYLN
jgi:hypothetical protein